MELMRQEENGGAERKRELCVWVLGESDGKKEKKKEKRGFMGRERIHTSMVLRQWVRYRSHKK